MRADIAMPARDCELCPRLAAFRESNRRTYPEWHNAPVASFGKAGARLLIVGLAPGLKGANRTGRPFTGDYAGDLLYETLLRFALAEGTYGASASDGLTLTDCRITNVVRCVPPQNKPIGAEIATCGRFLASEIAAMPALKAILALGVVAHNAAVKTLALRRSDYPFRHGAIYRPAGRPALADSYHCSRYNTNTGRLTPEMFEAVFTALTPILVDD